MLTRDSGRRLPDVCVLFEDEHFLAVHKPAGVPSQPDPSGEPSILDLFPGTQLIHRLDQPASGILLLGKSEVATQRLSQAFQEHRLTKLYLVVVQGVPAQEEGRLEHHLVHDKRKNISRAYDQPRKNSKRALLTYRVRAAGQRSLLEVELHTGRHHQIRAQLAHLGHPIVNDAKYKGKRNRAKGIALHAWRLELDHPVAQHKLTLEALPTSAFFQGFKIDSPA